LAFETLMDYGTVASVKASNRFEVLSFAHHIQAKASKEEAISHPSPGERLVRLRAEKQTLVAGGQR
jgi:hypothetical protein